MKAEFNEKGYLVIIAENNVEAYALDKWVKENIPLHQDICSKFKFPNLVFDCTCVCANEND